MELLGAYLAIQQIQRGLKPNNIPHLFEKGYILPYRFFLLTRAVPLDFSPNDRTE